MSGTFPDSELIEQTALDYFQGWFDGDVERMDRALHKNLVKRWPGSDEGAELTPVTKERMLELTAQHEGKDDVGDGRLEVNIVDVHEDIANLVVRGGVYREYIQMVRTAEGWKIANTLWRFE
jgi:ketosteroid isomerase-like protein